MFALVYWLLPDMIFNARILIHKEASQLAQYY